MLEQLNIFQPLTLLSELYVNTHNTEWFYIKLLPFARFMQICRQYANLFYRDKQKSVFNKAGSYAIKTIACITDIKKKL